jgi:hypothetical protein
VEGFGQPWGAKRVKNSVTGFVPHQIAFGRAFELDDGVGRGNTIKGAQIRSAKLFSVFLNR